MLSFAKEELRARPARAGPSVLTSSLQLSSAASGGSGGASPAGGYYSARSSAASSSAGGSSGDGLSPRSGEGAYPVARVRVAARRAPRAARGVGAGSSGRAR